MVTIHRHEIEGLLQGWGIFFTIIWIGIMAYNMIYSKPKTNEKKL